MNYEDLIVGPGEVLDFWFGGVQKENYKTKWFPANKELEAKVDHEVYHRFNSTFEAALDGGLDAWKRKGVREHVALIVVLDQFSRHIYRFKKLEGDDEERKIADLEALSTAKEFAENYMDGASDGGGYVGDTASSSEPSPRSSSPVSPKSALRNSEVKAPSSSQTTQAQTQAQKKKGHRRTANVNATRTRTRRTSEDGDVSVEFADEDPGSFQDSSSLACLWELQAFFSPNRKSSTRSSTTRDTSPRRGSVMCGYDGNGHGTGRERETSRDGVKWANTKAENDDTISICSTAEKVFALMPFRHSPTLSRLAYVQQQADSMQQQGIWDQELLGRFKKQTVRRMQHLQDREKANTASSILEFEYFDYRKRNQDQDKAKKEKEKSGGKGGEKGGDIMQHKLVLAIEAFLLEHMPAWDDSLPSSSTTSPPPASSTGASTASPTGAGGGVSNESRDDNDSLGTPVAISLSGGVDSMVIAMILCLLRDKYSPKAHVAADGGVKANKKKRAGSGTLLHNNSNNKSSSSSSSSSKVIRIGTVLAVHIDYANREESVEEAAYVQWYVSF